MLQRINLIFSSFSIILLENKQKKFFKYPKISDLFLHCGSKACVKNEKEGRGDLSMQISYGNMCAIMPHKATFKALFRESSITSADGLVARLSGATEHVLDTSDIFSNE